MNVRKAFENAPPGVRFSVDEALRVLKGNTAADAVAALHRLSNADGLSVGQKQSLGALIAGLKTGSVGLTTH